jgi:acetyl-CoA C-acetyltransferase
LTPNIDPSTPVLIGWHSVSRRDADPRDGREAIELMTAAAHGALACSNSKVPAPRVDWIGATAGLTRYADPAGLVGERIGAQDAHTVLAHIGVMQQTLVSHACQAVQSGQHRIALVVGAEAQYRTVRCTAAGEAAPVTVQPDGVCPDESLTSPAFDQAMSHPAEAFVGLSATPAYYALIDSFWRGQCGRSVAGHRDDLAQLYARFAEIAAENPQAVRTLGYSAEEVRDPSDRNPMIAFPYTKLMVTTWTVDQGCALLFTTAGFADELGVTRSRWRYPVIAVESNHVVPVSARTRLSQPAAMRIIGETVWRSAGVDTSGIELVDLYSAFPAPVLIGAEGLRIPPGHDLTLTGGMSFAGGPLNSYVLHAIAAAADRLGTSAARAALVSCVSGLYSKQGAFVLAAAPPASPFDTVDVTAMVAEAEPALAVVTDAHGPGRIVAYTVVFEAGAPERAIAVVDLADSRRAVARNHDVDVMARALVDDLLGVAVTLSDGVFCLADSRKREDSSA